MSELLRPEATIDPTTTLHGIAQEVDAYRRELRQWIESPSRNDTTLYVAGRALCDVAAKHGMRPEQLLVALHPHGARSPWRSPESGYDDRQELRYRWAVRLLLRTYFGLEARPDLYSRSDG
jgi:hypothetical protein